MSSVPSPHLPADENSVPARMSEAHGRPIRWLMLPPWRTFGHKPWPLLVAHAILVLLFVQVHLDNALLYHPMLQKPGNVFDENRLTLALRQEYSPEEIISQTQWAPSIIYTAYYADHWFGMQTRGRRILATAMIALAFFMLLMVGLRIGWFDPIQAFVFGFLFAASAELPVYSSLGLITYPWLIPLSAFALWGGARSYGRSCSWAAWILMTLLFALLSWFDVRLIMIVYAVSATLALGELLRLPVSAANTLRSLGKVTMLTGPATICAVLPLVLHPHPELLNPYRNLQLYFEMSGYAHSLSGALEFIAAQFTNVARQALALHPLLLGEKWVPRSGMILSLFFLLGLGGSFVRIKSPRFPVAIMFFAGTIGHLILSFAGLLPYGELRYVLPFYMFYPIMAALGLSDAFILFCAPITTTHRARQALIEWWNSLKKLSHAIGALPEAVYCLLMAPGVWTRPFLLGIFVLGLLTVYGLFSFRMTRWSERVDRVLEQNMSTILENPATAGFPVVLDEWTATTAIHDFPALERRKNYVLNTNLRTSWRGAKPEQVDDLQMWERYLTAHDRLYLVTSMPFTRQHYGSIFSEVSGRYRIKTYPMVERYYIIRLDKIR